MPETSRTFSCPDKKRLLAVPPAARAIHQIIVEKLGELNNCTVGRCTEEPFSFRWKEITGLSEQYQREIMKASSFAKSCKKGCCVCCNHWVDEVYSFEAEIIADFLQKRHRGKVPGIIGRCREDEAVFEQLEVLVERKLTGDEAQTVDEKDLLLSVFYQMDRPCPLLINNACVAREVRPLTCRNYVSFSDFRKCGPEYINDDQGGTYLFSLEDEARELMERLHEKYARFEGECGLRKLLPMYLDK